METNTGRFVWHELMTTDIPAAIAFYTEVVGWKTQPFEGAPAESPYTMWVSGQGPMGGVMNLPEDAKKMGAPPHWMGHVGVANVDATVAKAKSLGARVYVEPQDIPKVGRFSVIADPQGASISVFTSAEAMAPHDTSKPGEVSWNELLTTDHEAGLSFYSEVFGWKKLSEFDMGPMGKYFLFGIDKQFGGMMTKSAEMKFPPTWLYYFHVADLDASIERAKAKGAKLMMGPMEVPDGTRVAQLMDPQGAAFALHGDALKKAS